MDSSTVYGIIDWGGLYNTALDHLNRLENESFNL